MDFCKIVPTAFQDQKLTDAGSLLNIMAIRLAMAEAGTTAPPEHVVHEIRKLVSKLKSLESDAKIDISILSRNPLRIQYMDAQTGVILAELDETNSA